jgi:hypothetical protein
VSQYQTVEPGTPLYRLDSAAWRSIQEQISAADSAVKQTSAKLASMHPLRAAHRQHEASLQAKVTLWQERLAQLEELRAAGGGSAAQLTEARAMLNETQAELADTMEKDAELESREQELAAELVAASARLELLLGTAASLTGFASTELLAEQMVDGRSQPRWRTMSMLEVRSSVAGVVERLEVTDGGFAEESALVLVTVQPDQLRFRARGLQSDLGRLRDGLRVRVVPPQGSTIPLQDTVSGTLTIGMVADPQERTIDLLLLPERLGSWTRAGVSASMEITLMAVDVFPELNAPTVVVMTEAGGLAADEVELNVTFPIETAVNGLPGTRRVRSSSGHVAVSRLGRVRLGRGHLSRAAARRRAALAPCASRCQRTSHTEITPVTSITGEIMLLALSSPDGAVSPLDLRAYAEFDLRNKLLGVPGVSQVVAIGGELPEYQVNVQAGPAGALRPHGRGRGGGGAQGAQRRERGVPVADERIAQELPMRQAARVTACATSHRRWSRMKNGDAGHHRSGRRGDAGGRAQARNRRGIRACRRWCCPFRSRPAPTPSR